MMKYVRRDKVTTRKVVDETLLVPVRADVEEMEFFYVLNEVGEVIWENLESPKTLDELTALVGSEFEGASSEELHADVGEFLGDLQQYGLVSNA